MVLPGEGGEAVRDEVAHLAGRLVDHRAREIEDAWADVGADVRVQRWREILAGLGDVLDTGNAWRLFAYHPGTVIGSFSLGERRSQRWRILTDVYEAWYGLAADGKVPGVDRRSATLGAGFLARTRWLLLSAPFRKGFEHLDPTETESLVERARQAREEWIAVLDAIDDHPNLRAAVDVEDEAVKIALVVLEGRASGRDLARADLAGHLVTRLLLPRFAWLPAVQVLRGVWGRGTVVHLSAGASLFVVAAVIFTLAAWDVWRWGYTGAAILALAGYVVVAVGSAVRPRLGWPWLLRQPAGAAVGMLALIALPDWWSTADSGAAAVASGVLALVGIGYLMVEAGNHGTRSIIRRSLGVGLFGLFQSAMVSLIGLRFLFPVFAASVEKVRISCWWTGCSGDALPPWLLLLTTTAWSFVVGVFLQITWNDQPITAPLAHVSWRRGK